MPTKQEIANYLSPFATTPNWYGGSMLSQYRTAAAQQGALNELYNGIEHDGNYDLFNSSLKGMKGSAIAGGITAGLTGATTLLAGAQQGAHINDTSMYEGQIEDLSRAGNYNYNNYAQLEHDYAQTAFNPEFNYQDIRGMTTGQQVGNVASSVLSGASTGMTIGGPWGALVGGVVGLGTGLGGVLTGNARAKAKQEALEASALVAQDASQANFEAAHERIREEQNRRGAVNMVAGGGKIERKQLTAKEFAAKVMTGKGEAPARIIRSKGEGGTIVRIRVK